MFSQPIQHTRSVEQFIQKNRLPHLLFYGPPGTGKTSTILAMARRIYGDEYRKQILEVGTYHSPTMSGLTLFLLFPRM